MHMHIYMHVPYTKHIKCFKNIVIKLLEEWGSQSTPSMRLRTDGRMYALTVGYFLGTYSTRKRSTQQIPDIFYGINLNFSKLAPFICKWGLFHNWHLKTINFRNLKYPTRVHLWVRTDEQTHFNRRWRTNKDKLFLLDFPNCVAMSHVLAVKSMIPLLLLKLKPSNKDWHFLFGI